MTSGYNFCHSCGDSLLSPLFCFTCNSIQIISDEIDHFEIMGLNHCFEIDLEKFENLYQNLSLELHPDFYGAATEENKILSEKYSAMLNAAYSTLREPVSRAQYLLYLLTKGETLKKDDLPEGFLHEMFSLQVSLDEMLESCDQSSLSKLNEDLLERSNLIQSNYASLFKKLENSPKKIEILQQIQTQLNTERYLKRLLDRINYK